MKTFNKEEWKKLITPGQFPKNITNELIDEINKSDDKEMFWRWGLCSRDISGCDLSKLDRGHIALLTFDSSTIWPTEDNLPKGFDPNKILNKGKDPLLGIKSLHEKGITGMGVTVACIDSGFQGQKHVEFNGSSIEEINLFGDDVHTHFHAEGVLSNLCGQNIGIAPKCKVIHYNTQIGGPDFTSQRLACLNNILKRVQSGEAIRAVNLSGPLGNEDYLKQHPEIKKQFEDIIKELSSLRCEVVDSSRFGEVFSCCGYDWDDDYSDISKLKRPKWFEAADKYKEEVSFVNGGKVVPEFCSDTGYKFEQEMCYSWTIPQAVGLYALCLQQNSDLTWDKFTALCKETSIQNGNGVRVAQPAQLMKRLAQSRKIKRHK